MYNRPRIIPCLLLDNGDMVKTIGFSKPRYLGDPINAVKIFNNKGVDELCILDRSATREGKGPDIGLLRDIATEAFMPLSYGGGITSMEEIRKLFSVGYEKVIFNTALVKYPELIQQAVVYAGSQSIVASIDVKTDFLSRSFCFTHDGKEKTNFTPITLAKEAERLGVGEILLNCINRDGEMRGYEINIVRSVADSVSVPVIACGGAGCLDDIKAVLTDGHAHAAAAGSFFVYYGSNRAILITAPNEAEYISSGIFIEA